MLKDLALSDWQMVALASKCAGFSESTIHHEVLHALGFEHEHARHDRDKFLNVNLEVVPFLVFSNLLDL